MQVTGIKTVAGYCAFAKLQRSKAGSRLPGLNTSLLFSCIPLSHYHIITLSHWYFISIRRLYSQQFLNEEIPFPQPPIRPAIAMAHTGDHQQIEHLAGFDKRACET